MLHLTTSNLKKVTADVIVIPVCEDEMMFSSPDIVALVEEAKRFKEFQGRKSDEITLYDVSGVKARRIRFAGLGKAADVRPESFRRLAGAAVRHGIKKGFQRMVFAAPDPDRWEPPVEPVLEALLEGACLGNHLFDAYKKEKKNKPLKKISIRTSGSLMRSCRDIPARIRTICGGTLLARNWVSTPPNDKTPEQLSRLILSEAKKEKLKTRVLNENELKKLNMNALLAVAAGSRSSARLVVMEHAPAGAGKATVLVGKGVTFDSGGINLKPSGSLEEMKMDMAGAAAVAATMITLAKLGVRRKVIGVIPIVENMPSGSATRPGDIVTSYTGKSVEIGNTDAEGRLILADAMAWAEKRYKPETVIDLATLTGACIMALGEKIAGVFSTDDRLADELTAAGEKTHERCWRMPLPEDYRELIKSELADIRNLASSRWGGAITAALFLSEFITVSRWAHIDIAGPAYTKKETPYCPAGGTGFGVRLLCEIVREKS